MTELPPEPPETPPDDSTVPASAGPGEGRRRWRWPWPKRWKRPTRRQVFRAISWTVGIGFILLVALGYWVYRSAVGRFEVRRLRLPTRIYADYMPLTAG